MKKSLSAVVFLLWAALATGAPVTAEQLASECSDEPQTAKSAEELVAIFGCIGYISGVLDTHAVMVGIYHSPKVFCAPSEGVSHEAAILALLQWLKRHRTEGDMSARTAILLALRERFPC
ncbi:Rap1a/Tai family immunity protein [Cupriavidus basilensis]